MNSPVPWLSDDVFASMPVWERALHIAATQVGVEEHPKGSNSGPQVEKYLASVGLSGSHAPWCRAFQVWCYETAGYDGPWPDDGLVIHLKRWAEKVGRDREKPKRGRLFVIDNGDGTGHTGFVTDVYADGSYSTCEGNTNDDGSREGYGVFRRHRFPSKRTSFVEMA